MTPISLDWYEYEFSAYVGFRRDIESKRKGHKAAHGAPETAPVDWSIRGSVAEYVVAKHLGITWTGHINHFGGADLLDNIQVRHRPKDHHKLIVRPNDPDDHYYFLVTGYYPTYNIQGCILGADAKSIGTFSDGGNGRPACYWVPSKDLQPC